MAGWLSRAATTAPCAVWDLAAGKELRAWGGHAGSVTSVALALDGKRALSGSHDRTVRLWDVGGGLDDLEGHQGAVYSVAFSADGQRALSGGNDRAVRLWDVRTGKEVKRLPVTPTPWCRWP